MYIVMCLLLILFFFFKYTATHEIYTFCHTLSLHDALPISRCCATARAGCGSAPSTAWRTGCCACTGRTRSCPKASRSSTATTSCAWSIAWSSSSNRSEEHTSELQSLMRISYDVFCLKKKKIQQHNTKLKTHTSQLRS